jgi:hypothetical protein
MIKNNNRPEQKPKSGPSGPRSREGKAKSSQNALKSGHRSEAIVISRLGESRGDFEKFQTRLLSELAPVGILEEVVAERLCSICWRLRRFSRSEMQQLDIEAAGVAQKASWERALRGAIKTLGTGSLLTKSEMSELKKVPFLNYFGLAIIENMLEKQELFGLSNSPSQEKGFVKIPTSDALRTELEGALRQVLELSSNVQTKTPSELSELNLDLNYSRYETALSRQLYRTIEEFERLQRVRKDGPRSVPPTIKVSVSNDD